LARLGNDEHGVWLGAVAGTVFTRPDVVAYEATGPLVMLVPADRAWVATFYGDGHRHDTRIYVDMATPAVWSASGAEVTMVDLDLDVVRTRGGRIYVDDKDEFAEHQVRFAYPREVVRMAESSRDEVLSAVRAEQAPFVPAVWEPWLGRVS
jgi:protein associated with RNAse G/E